MKRSSILKIKAFRKKWFSIKDAASNDEDSSLTFSVAWIDELEVALRRSKYDKEFTGDVINSAYRFFLEEMSDDEKADAFAYLLGKLVRKL